MFDALHRHFGANGCEMRDSAQFVSQKIFEFGRVFEENSKNIVVIASHSEAVLNFRIHFDRPFKIGQRISLLIRKPDIDEDVKIES